MCCCTPCADLSRCCSSNCLDYCCDRWCGFYGATNCCCPCASCTTLKCCPSLPCCLSPCSCICQPCRRPHIWEIRNCVKTSSMRNKDACRPGSRCRTRSRASRRKTRRTTICTACANEGGMNNEDDFCPALVSSDVHASCECETPGTPNMSGTGTGTGSGSDRRTPQNSQKQSFPFVEPTSSKRQMSARGTQPPAVSTNQKSRVDSGINAQSMSARITQQSTSTRFTQQSTSTQHQFQVQLSPGFSIKPYLGELHDQSETSKKCIPSANPPEFEALERQLSMAMEMSTQTDPAKSEWRVSPPVLSALPALTPPQLFAPPFLAPPMLGPLAPHCPLHHPALAQRPLRHTPLGFLASPPLPPAAPFGLPLMCMPFSMPLGLPKDPASVVCSFCGSRGHIAENCPKYISLKVDDDSQKSHRTHIISPEKQSQDKKQEDKRSTNVRILTSSGSPTPFMEDSHGKPTTNSVFFIQRSNGPYNTTTTLPNKMYEPWLQQSAQSRKCASRDSRRSRFQRDRDQERSLTSDSQSPWRNRSPSLRSISSQTSAELRKPLREYSSLFHRPHYLSPRKFPKPQRIPSAKVLLTETASQTWPTRSDFSSQTSNKEDEYTNRNFSPQNVFFVATPSVTNAWCRAVCGDSVADFPKILEKFTSAKEKSDTYKKGIASSKSECAEKLVSRSVAVTQCDENCGCRSNEVFGNGDIRDGVLEKNRFVGNNEDGAQKPTYISTGSMVTQNDLSKKSRFALKREKISSLLARTDQSIIRARERLLKGSTSKISVSCSPSDAKSLGRLTRAVSLQQLNVRQQLTPDTPRKEKPSTPAQSGINDVIMAGPGIALEKGVNTNSKTQPEQPTKGPSTKGKANHNTGSTITAGAARTAINKLARRLTSPVHTPKRIFPNHQQRSTSNHPSVPSPNTKNIKILEMKPTVNPSVFGREPNTVQRLSQPTELSPLTEITQPDDNDFSNWKNGIDPLSVTKISVSLRTKPAVGTHLPVQNPEYESLEPRTEQEAKVPAINRGPQTTKDNVYHVSEVEIPGKKCKAQNNEMLGDTTDNECFDFRDNEIRNDIVFDTSTGPSSSPAPVSNDSACGHTRLSYVRKIQANDLRSAYQHPSVHVPKLPSVDEEDRQNSEFTVSRQEITTGYEQQTKISEFDQTRSQENNSFPRNALPQVSQNFSKPAKIGSNNLASYLTSNEVKQNVRKIPQGVLLGSRKVSPSPTNGAQSTCDRMSAQQQGLPHSRVFQQSSVRPLESRVEIEDVGADEMEDYQYFVWNRDLRDGTNVQREKSKTNVAPTLCKDVSRHSIRLSNLSKKPSRMSLSQQNTDCNTTRWESPLQMSPPPVTQHAAYAQSYASSQPPPPGLPSAPPPSAASLVQSPAIVPPFTFGAISEKTQSGNHRVARHEYYTSPSNYYGSSASSNVATQALPHPYQSSEFCGAPPMPHSHLMPQERTCQQYVIFPTQQPQSSVHQSLLPRHTDSLPVQPSRDQRTPLEKLDEALSNQRWKFPRTTLGLPGLKNMPVSEDTSETCEAHEVDSSAARKTYKVSHNLKATVDYGPEVPIDIRHGECEIDHCHRTMRHRDERSYADTTEIVVPVRSKSGWNGSRHKSKTHLESRNAKKKREYYYELIPSGRGSLKPRCQVVALRPADRDDPRVKEKPDQGHRHGHRSSKDDGLMYEIDDFRGDSDLEYLRRTKMGLVSSRPRHAKSSRSHGYHYHLSSKRRAITPQTPMTSSSCGPRYTPHHYKGHSNRDHSHHGHRGSKRRLSNMKWE